MNSDLYLLQKWIRTSNDVVVITGSAFSEEAGFPDYRKMDEGFLDTYRYTPDEMLCLTFMRRYPFYFFRYYRDKILAPVLNAQPGAAHQKLVELEEAGHLKGIITVNIDGIHQEAGSKNVIETHGSIMRSWCARCEKYLDFFYVSESPTPVPYCNVDMCGDIVRPDIVLKEEPYNLEVLSKAAELVRNANVLVVDGSAIQEFPVPNLIKLFTGHKLIMMNTAPLVFDSRAGLVIRGSYNDLFSQIDLNAPLD